MHCDQPRLVKSFLSGEPVRLLFKYFRVPFDDARLTKEEWADRKTGTVVTVLLSIDHRTLRSSFRDRSATRDRWREEGRYGSELRSKIKDHISGARRQSGHISLSGQDSWTGGWVVDLWSLISDPLPSGFIGKTKSDAAKADAFVYASVDMFIPFYMVKMAEDDEKRVIFDICSLTFDLWSLGRSHGLPGQLCGSLPSLCREASRCTREPLRSSAWGTDLIVDLWSLSCSLTFELIFDLCQITWADIYVLFVVHTLENMKPEFVDKVDLWSFWQFFELNSWFEEEYPHVVKHYARMRGLPQLKEYIEEKWPSKIL